MTTKKIEKLVRRFKQGEITKESDTFVIKKTAIKNIYGSYDFKRLCYKIAGLEKKTFTHKITEVHARYQDFMKAYSALSSEEC